MKTYSNEDKSKIYSEINLSLIKLKIENELMIDKYEKIGKSQLTFSKLKRLVEYKIEKNYFKFHIFDKIDQPSSSYKGKVNLKPFWSASMSDIE